MSERLVMNAIITNWRACRSSIIIHPVVSGVKTSLLILLIMVPGPTNRELFARGRKNDIRLPRSLSRFPKRTIVSIIVLAVMPSHITILLPRLSNHVHARGTKIDDILQFHRQHPKATLPSTNTAITTSTTTDTMHPPHPTGAAAGVGYLVSRNFYTRGIRTLAVSPDREM